eukprot:s2985_g10.t1
MRFLHVNQGLISLESLIATCRLLSAGACNIDPSPWKASASETQHATAWCQLACHGGILRTQRWSMAGSQLFNRVAIPLDDPLCKRLESAKPLDLTPNPKESRNGVETTTRQAKLLGNERRISILSITVSGARDACNGSYKFDGLHQGKPLFKSDTGAIIYFQRFWKMNAAYRTSSWMYSLPDSRTALPPEGEWTREGSVEMTSGSAPTLSLVDECFKSLGEQGSSLRLEGGRTVLKREENKSWRWIELPVYEQRPSRPPAAQKEVAEEQVPQAALPSLEDLCAKLDAEETADRLNFGLLGHIDEEDEEQPSSLPPSGYFSSDMIRQMGQGMLAQIARDPRSEPCSTSPEAADEPPWPLEQPRVGMAARLMKSDAESQRGDAGNLLRANRLRFR